jgi:peptide/nickel transport system permease protein
MKRAAVLVILAGLVLLLPNFAPYDPMLTDPINRLQSPSLAHVFGTDTFGRDVFSRWLHGGSRTLLSAAVATSIGAVGGVLFGVSMGGRFGFVSAFSTLLMQALLTMPGLVTGLVMVTLLGVGSPSIVLAVGLSQVAPMSFVLRAAVEQIRSADYVTAAVSAGASPFRIARDVMARNIAPVLWSYVGVVFAYCLLNSAALSFLGLSGDPSIPDWGAMLYEGRIAFREAPLLSLFPGAAITLTVLLINWATQDRLRG